jgi:hypothetical protein
VDSADYIKTNNRWDTAMSSTSAAATLDAASIKPVTGWSGDADYFVVREYQAFEPEAVLDVLRGKVAGVIFRGMIKPEDCAELANRFWNNPNRQTRGVEAPGYYMGAYTWQKPTAQYLDETEQIAAALDEYLDVPNNPLATFYGGLADVLAKEGGTVRLAQHEGRQGCRALLRSWHGQGEYALAPHDDNSQLTQPGQADFEIQKVGSRPTGALNICLENGNGGRLAYWNIQADVASKTALGVEYTGSPYPMASLEGFEMKWVEVNAGDVYVFNGNHVHAVEPNTDPSLRRTTLAGMMGFIDDRTVVTWT